MVNYKLALQLVVGITRTLRGRALRQSALLITGLANYLRCKKFIIIRVDCAHHRHRANS